MLQRLILKVTKFQLPLPTRLITVVKTFWGAIMPPMSNRVNQMTLPTTSVSPIMQSNAALTAFLYKKMSKEDANIIMEFPDLSN